MKTGAWGYSCGCRERRQRVALNGTNGTTAGDSPEGIDVEHKMCSKGCDICQQKHSETLGANIA